MLLLHVINKSSALWKALITSGAAGYPTCYHKNDCRTWVQTAGDGGGGRGDGPGMEDVNCLNSSSTSSQALRPTLMIVMALVT